ncbi:MAG: RNA polymerase sigma factor [Sneathiellales bacterium]|nr:RNA polymerase sigma factor [Sneathiellales bacterium]
MPENKWLTSRFSQIRPKAIGALNRYFRDIDLAEEAFSISCTRALSHWQKNGLPDDPLAWLLTVGRNAGRDIIRKNARLESLDEKQEELAAQQISENEELIGFRDDVLRLMFICCHPDLSPQDQSALALKIVAGLSISEIASAFLVKPKTMEQRIRRAKKTISEANIPFEIPSMIERNTRLKSVMLMLYLLFNEGWSASSGEAPVKATVCNEAIRLTRTLLELFPSITELMGLLALFLYQHSRREARADIKGDLLPLEEQDRSLWDLGMIKEAHALMEKSVRHMTPGPYQIQAAIAGVHARSKSDEKTDWHEIEKLYSALYALEPSPVVKLNHAAAIAKTKGPVAALETLSPLCEELKAYKWFHAMRASLYLEIEDFAAAKVAYEKVLSLNPLAAEKRFIEEKLEFCKKNL